MLLFLIPLFACSSNPVASVEEVDILHGIVSTRDSSVRTAVKDHDAIVRFSFHSGDWRFTRKWESGFQDMEQEGTYDFAYCTDKWTCTYFFESEDGKRYDYRTGWHTIESAVWYATVTVGKRHVLMGRTIYDIVVDPAAVE
ncbi:hypothetical protein CMI37_37515 [Candidatus Pacearchaeota archaeon]|nr:hypothetical protein [Candidatus Pacearchaeota archaeon]